VRKRVSFSASEKAVEVALLLFQLVPQDIFSILDAYSFFPRIMTAHDFDPGGSNSQRFGKEATGEAIGLSPLRRGGNPNPKKFTLESRDLIPGGSGLNPKIQNPRRRAFAFPLHDHLVKSPQNDGFVKIPDAKRAKTEE